MSNVIQWTPAANSRLIVTETTPIVNASLTTPASGTRELNYGPWGGSQHCNRQLSVKDSTGAVLYTNTPQVTAALRVTVGPTQTTRGVVMVLGLSANTTYTVEFNCVNPDGSSSVVPGGGSLDFYVDLNNMGD